MPSRSTSRKLPEPALRQNTPLFLRASTTGLQNTRTAARPRPALGKDIRIGIVLPYIVIYRRREADDTVTVLRVVHGHRNITTKLISD